MSFNACRFIAGGLLLLAACGAPAQEALAISRQDNGRVPLSVYPATTGDCRGVAVISPGAGGTEKGYKYLGHAMASMGYLTAVVGHAESGPAALRNRLQGKQLRDGLIDLTTDPNAYRGRFMDIAATLAWAKSRCSAAEAVLVGHSMGAATALLEAGARNRLDLSGTDSFTAYIAISPQGVGSLFPQNAWAAIQRPVLSLTGTHDDGLEGATWQWRTEPYEGMPPGCKSLGVVRGATHMNFAGVGASRRVEELSTRTIAAFLDGVRRGDCKLAVQHPDLDVRSK